MRRSRDAKGTEDADLSPIEVEPAEHFLVTQRHVAPEPGQARGDLEISHLELGLKLGQAVDQSIREVSHHGSHATGGHISL